MLYNNIFYDIRHRAVGSACVFRGTNKAFSLKLLAHQRLKRWSLQLEPQRSVWACSLKLRSPSVSGALLLGTPTPDSLRLVGIRRHGSHPPGAPGQPPQPPRSSFQLTISSIKKHLKF